MDELPEVAEQEPGPIRRFLIIMVSLVLIILLVTYFATTPQVRSIIAGYFESSMLNDERVRINSTTDLIFLGDSKEDLLRLFDENLGQEFKVCLLGFIDRDYLVQEIFIPETYLQSHDRVVAEPCPDGSLVSMHSHPIQHCLPSDVDLENFARFKQKSPYSIMAVMCERDRFSFYR